MAPPYDISAENITPSALERRVTSKWTLSTLHAKDSIGHHNHHAKYGLKELLFMAEERDVLQRQEMGSHTKFAAIKVKFLRRLFFIFDI